MARHTSWWVGRTPGQSDWVKPTHGPEKTEIKNNIKTKAPREMDMWYSRAAARSIWFAVICMWFDWISAEDQTFLFIFWRQSFSWCWIYSQNSLESMFLSFFVLSLISDDSHIYSYPPFASCPFLNAIFWSSLVFSLRTSDKCCYDYYASLSKWSTYLVSSQLQSWYLKWMLSGTENTPKSADCSHCPLQI